MINRRTLGLALVAGLAATSAAFAGPIPTVIFAETGPKSAVPGLPGVNFTSFDRPYRSLSGNWIISAQTSTGATATDEVLLSGSGLVGMLRVQEGVTAIEAGRTIDSASIDSRYGINDSGDIVFTGNLSGASTDDEAIIVGLSGGSFTIPYREGQTVGAIPEAIGTTNSAPSISNGGVVSFRAFAMAGAPTATNAALIRGGSTLDARKGVTIPGGLAAGTESTFQNLDTNEYYVDAAGTNWVAVGDTNFATSSQDDVAVYNGNAIVQEGFAIPGTSFTSGVLSIGQAGIVPSGEFWVRGSNSDAQDWVIYGDASSVSVVAKTGDAITASATETWSDAPFSSTFFLFAADNAGNYVVGGTTDNADDLANAVLVYNGNFELIREGDAVDLDGNGILDDGAFVSTFNNDDCFLDGSTFYFTADIKDATGAALGQAFLAMTVPAPSAAALLGLAGLAFGRRRR